MNKEMMKKTVAEKMVNLAVQSADLSQTSCCTLLFLGKPKENIKLTSDDYAALAAFMKRSQS